MEALARNSRQRTKKLTRAERQEQTRSRLFAAAATLVGKHGYADTTIQEITRQAGVALGTFYNYFESRQDLLDQLLPALGLEMYTHVRERVAGVDSEIDKEEARFRAFFEFLQIRPEFYRILHEAEQFAPRGYKQHIANISKGYVRALQRGREAGAVAPYSDLDLEVISYILMAARDYLSMRYSLARGKVHALPEEVVAAYMRLLKIGLFTSRKT